MYEKMYHVLFEAITDALDMIDRMEYQAAMSRLEIACMDAEEVYIMQGETILGPTESSPASDDCPPWCPLGGKTINFTKKSRL